MFYFGPVGFSTLFLDGNILDQVTGKGFNYIFLQHHLSLCSSHYAEIRILPTIPLFRNGRSPVPSQPNDSLTARFSLRAAVAAQSPVHRYAAARLRGSPAATAAGPVAALSRYARAPPAAGPQRRTAPPPTLSARSRAGSAATGPRCPWVAAQAVGGKRGPVGTAELRARPGLCEVAACVR